jgi:hypothetical protein
MSNHTPKGAINTKTKADRSQTKRQPKMTDKKQSAPIPHGKKNRNRQTKQKSLAKK